MRNRIKLDQVQVKKDEIQPEEALIFRRKCSISWRWDLKPTCARHDSKAPPFSMSAHMDMAVPFHVQHTLGFLLVSIC